MDFFSQEYHRFVINYVARACLENNPESAFSGVELSL